MDSRPQSTRSVKVQRAGTNGGMRSPPSPTLTATTEATTRSRAFGEQAPKVVVSRADLKASLAAYENLLSQAKAYRNALLALATATSGFACALEDCSRQKGAAGVDDDEPGYSASERLMAAAGLHHIAGNHTQILADSLYKSFEIPLLEKLDEHRQVVAERQAAYEKQVEAKAKVIQQTEAANMKHGKKKMRDLGAFRRALANLQNQVDELDRLKFTYYSELLDGQAETWDLIASKTAIVVHSEQSLYDRVASKATADPVLEGMVQSVLDPFGEWGRPEDFNADGSNRLFSILAPLDLIPPQGLPRVMSPPPALNREATPQASRTRSDSTATEESAYNTSPETPRRQASTFSDATIPAHDTSPSQGRGTTTN